MIYKDLLHPKGDLTTYLIYKLILDQQKEIDYCMELMH